MLALKPCRERIVLQKVLGQIRVVSLKHQAGRICERVHIVPLGDLSQDAPQIGGAFGGFNLQKAVMLLDGETEAAQSKGERRSFHGATAGCYDKRGRPILCLLYTSDAADE